MTSGAPRWGGFGGKCARHQGGPSGVCLLSFLMLCLGVVGIVMSLVQMSRAASNVMLVGIDIFVVS